MQKAQLNLLKKQQVCTDSIMKDFNYKLSLPLDQGQVQKSNNIVLDHQGAPPDAKDAIQKDVRAPLIEFTFDLQKDVQANSKDPKIQGQIDNSYKVNFNKIQLQDFFEELEKVQLKLDQLNA